MVVDIDESYFLNKYLSQTIQDYSEIIKLLRQTNNISITEVDQLERGVQEISNVSSNIKDFSQLSVDQKSALKDIVTYTRQFSKYYDKILKFKTGVVSGSQQYQEAQQAYEALRKGANNVQKFTATLSKNQGDLYPHGMTGSYAKKSITSDYEQNKKEYATNQDILTKVQQIQAQSLLPPMPATASTFTTSAPQNQKDSIAEKVMTIVSSVIKGLQSFADALQNFTAQVSQAFVTMMNAFGSILDSPLDSVVGLMSGLGQLMSQGFSMLSGLINSIAEVITGILDIFAVSGDKEGSKSQAISGLISQIVGIITSLFNLAIQAIQAGFNIFASTLQAVFKIVKKIAESSPIIRQILELLNLAFNLFFMPFMNQFALALLNDVVNLLDWAVQTGEGYQALGQGLLEEFENEGLNIGEILDTVKDIAVSFIKNYLPQILDLIPELLAFATKFVKDILGNKDKIIEFMTKGIDAFGQLIDKGIITEFLQLGVDVMKWVKTNASTIVTFISKILNQSLNIAKWFMTFMKSSEVIGLNQDLNALDVATSVFLEALSGGNEDDDEFAVYQEHQATGIAVHRTYNGGIPVIAGEANENEYKLSERELKEIGKDTTVTVQYNGSILSTGDFKKMVRTTVSDVSNKSYFR